MSNGPRLSVTMGYIGTVAVDDIRQAVADYMRSEGCSCCQDIDAHSEHRRRLAELLDVPLYADGSGHDFSQFRSPGDRGG